MDALKGHPLVLDVLEDDIVLYSDKEFLKEAKGLFEEFKTKDLTLSFPELKGLQ